VRADGVNGFAYLPCVNAAGELLFEACGEPSPDLEGSMGTRRSVTITRESSAAFEERALDSLHRFQAMLPDLRAAEQAHKKKGADKYEGKWLKIGPSGLVATSVDGERWQSVEGEGEEEECAGSPVTSAVRRFEARLAALQAASNAVTRTHARFAGGYGGVRQVMHVSLELGLQENSFWVYR
jgi:hypothetical protein